MILWLIVGTIVASLLIARAGQNLRFGFWGYFFGSLLLTPVMGLLLLLAAQPPRVDRQALKRQAVRP